MIGLPEVSISSSDPAISTEQRCRRQKSHYREEPCFKPRLRWTLIPFVSYELPARAFGQQKNLVRADLSFPIKDLYTVAEVYHSRRRVSVSRGRMRHWQKTSQRMGRCPEYKSDTLNERAHISDD